MCGRRLESRAFSSVRRGLSASIVGALVCLGGCAGLLQYTDELTDSSTGRSPIVTTPATITGAAGFTVGLPISLVALPITYGVYTYQQTDNPATTDPASTMLFPSFVLWRAGTLLATPFDALDYAVIRAWQPERTPTREERETIEARIDEDMLPTYRVRPIYPP
jgi:hypothetical protein